jgi:glycogen phosphorylase
VTSDALIAKVQDRCVFTTHTPVPAGHDAFADTLVTEVLGTRRSEELSALDQLAGGELNMTELGMSLSHYVNGVSLRHQAVAQELAPRHRVESVTNGVHLATWVCQSVAELFDRHIPSWRADNALLRYFGGVATVDLDIAHAAAKSALLDSVEERAGRRLDPSALTIGLARRATPYKQTTLIFSDLERLRAIAEQGPLQVVCAGKAHPRDLEGQQLIEAIIAAGAALKGSVEIAFLPDYGLELAKLLCAGTDLWLNTPIKPYEASGTSGMKAAVNGVPSLSTLDGWWIEGHLEGVTGWAIGSLEDGDDASALYEALEDTVLPCYYEDHDRYLQVMRNAVALNASFFNTERVVREYAREAYGLTRR